MGFQDVKKISIRDVAALAGVSVGSASRVLNNAPNVTEDVRVKVERAVSVLQYRPNHAAQSLRSQTSKTIGCLFSDVSNPLYARAFRALEGCFRPDGYMLLLSNGLNDPEREIEILRTFQLRGMDGVIIAPGNERHAEVLDAVNRLSMPVVIYDRDMAVDCDAILLDHFNGVKTAVKHLISLGHQRIGIALWHGHSRPVRRRLAGYKAAFRELGLDVPNLIMQEATSTSSVFEDMMQTLRSDEPPTAMIVQGTYTLISALRAISRMGLRVPADISVIALGDTEFAQTYDPPLTALRTPIEQIAQKARLLLLERINGRRGNDDADHIGTAPTKELIPYEFIVRESCAPPGGAG
ncbi:LacI family DNA-binding transcriptional regulator [Allopusillimonas soli]|uniref:Substrate-binding domain-containing protein n=1 Tax=Allopusillimonas soli TaxID=659016 RepID=A0A853F5W1_9BURK|nr:substrate-binding domain-containing protein [Allopusillimonas soli]NYT35924.1 substrate-binding domain-containing protein [Allopusillimonas soli]TEA76280.1 LacI family DNA-binding transcriptional regulator [Allopusillimonas soli]